jgi:hypothetical protein
MEKSVENKPEKKMFAPEGIVQALEKDPAMKDLVTELSNAKAGLSNTTGGFFSDNGKLFGNVQAKFEQGIIDGLKKGDIVTAVAVFHTSEPCTRTPILEALLDAGAKVACVYKKRTNFGEASASVCATEENYSSALARFEALKEMYHSDFFKDTPVKDRINNLSRGLSGTSYLLETGTEKYFCSFQDQVGNNGERECRVWAGRDVKGRARERKWAVSVFLQDEAELNMDKMLKRERIAISATAPTPSPS